MALTVNTNLSSLVTQRALGSSKSELDQAMERLASGKRVNSAGDDAAGLSISARMEAQVSAYRMAIRNSEDGISLAQTAEGAMEEITEMLLRIRELAMASANGTYSDNDRKSLDLEVQQLKEEIDRITQNSVFNGRNLLDGTFSSIMQVGTQSSEAVTVDIADMTTASLGGITGATVTEAVTGVSFKGKEAQPTTTQLTFEANDDYTFVLKVTLPSDTIPTLNSQDDITLSYNIAASVVNGGAGDVVSEINRALREAPDHIAYSTAGASAGAATAAGTSPTAAVSPITEAVAAAADSIRVSYIGKSVSISNLNGMGISVEAGQVPTSVANNATYTTTGSISSSGARITYTSIDGGIGPANALSDTAVIGSARAAETSITNNGVTLVPTSAEVDLSSITALSAGTITVGLDAVNYTITVSDVDGVGGITYSDIAESVSKLNNISPALPSEYTVGFSTDGIVITKGDGEDFDLNLVSYVSSGSTNKFSGVAITVADTGATAATATIGTAATMSGGTATDSATLESIMYLDFLGNDSYKFKFAKGDGTSQTEFVDVYHNGTTSSLEAIAIELETNLSLLGVNYDFDVSVVDDRIKITEKGGLSFKISDFESESRGRVMASNEYGQTPVAGKSAVLLDDTEYVTSAVTYAKQAPTRTDVTLSFSQDDTYSFKISDGTATAVVNPAVADATDLASYAAQIRVALKQAGMDGVIDVKVNANSATTSTINPVSGHQTIQLIHRLGYEISIRDFASIENGEMFAEATKKASSDDMSVGVTRILNDDTGTSASRVKDIEITSESLASDALEIIDRAIEDVNMERAFLGAIQSRLNHTIDNLGNIATNTEAAKSRIVDADYASESAKLAKAQVLQQAGTAMLAQANASSQTVLSLLQG